LRDISHFEVLQTAFFAARHLVTPDSFTFSRDISHFHFLHKQRFALRCPVALRDTQFVTNARELLKNACFYFISM
jgi:hypothetical protein